MRLRRLNAARAWDADAVQRQWRELATKGQQAVDRVFTRRPTEDPNGFYDLCLAELDAATHISQSQCFASMPDFISELRRLQNDPTAPSAAPFSQEVYTSSQKLWLDFVLNGTIREHEPPQSKWRDAPIVIPALLFLVTGAFLIRPAMDDDRARNLGLEQWQAFVGFLLCLFVFGLICKALDRNSLGKKSRLHDQLLPWRLRG